MNQVEKKNEVPIAFLQAYLEACIEHWLEKKALMLLKEPKGDDERRKDVEASHLRYIGGSGSSGDVDSGL